VAEYDAIVVGGGPGGSTAAYHLARAGARVVVLDRKQFPRAKVCGDGLTPRAVGMLRDMGLGDQIAGYHRANGLRVFAGRRSMVLDFPKTSRWDDFGLVRPRKDLDWTIAQRAMEAGAEYRMSTEAVSAVLDRGRMTGVRWVRKEKAKGGGVVKADEGELLAPFTVIADGSSSSFGRTLGLPRREEYPLGLAIRTYYTSSGANDGLFESWLELEKDGRLLPGYGWIFPVGEGVVNVGVGIVAWPKPNGNGGRIAGDVRLNDLQRAFVDMLPPSYGITHEGQLEPFMSGRLQLGWTVARPYGDGFVLIGDAAGLVNPFTGEGIAYAMETGKLAAGFVAEALASGETTFLTGYQEALLETYGAYYRLGVTFLKMIRNPKLFRFMSATGMRSHKWMEFVTTFMANLPEEGGRGINDRGYRAMIKAAEKTFSDLRNPQIPDPPVVASMPARAARRSGSPGGSSSAPDGRVPGAPGRSDSASDGRVPGGPGKSDPALGNLGSGAQAPGTQASEPRPSETRSGEARGADVS
jgi:geranylgeranyl reductase family protein